MMSAIGKYLYCIYFFVGATLWMVMSVGVARAQQILAQWNFNDGTSQGWALNVQENGATNPNASSMRFVVSDQYAGCEAFFPGYGNLSEPASPNQPANACTGFVGAQPNGHNLRVTTLRGIQSEPPCLLPAVCAVDVAGCGGINNCCGGNLTNDILFARSPVFSTAGYTGVTLEFSWHMDGGLWPAGFFGPELRVLGEVFYSYDGTNWTLLQSANIGGGGGGQGQLRDQETWTRARVTSPLFDDRPSLYLGFRHVVQNLNNGGTMHTNYVLALAGGNDPSLPGLAIDDIVVFVPAASQQLSVVCPNPSPNTLNANAGQNFTFPIGISGQIGAADVTVSYGDGTPNTVLNDYTAFPYNFSHTYAAAGTYNYTVTVCQNGQQVVCSGTINVVDCPNDIVINATGATPVVLSACGANDGQMTFNITPNIGQNYNLTIVPPGPTLIPGQGFSNMGPGTYFVTATNPNNNCSSIYELNVVAPVGIQSVVAVNATCELNNGEVIVTLTPGCGQTPFNYTLELGGNPQASISVDPNNSPNPWNHTFTGVAPGVGYVVRVRDGANTNVVSAPFDVINVGPPAPTFSVASTEPTGCNAANGTMTVSPSGGTPPYTITIFGVNNPYLQTQTDNNAMSVNNLPAGTYGVTVVDDDGCPGQTTDALPITLVDQGAPTLTVTGFGATTCNPVNGRINISLSAGTATSYSLDGGLSFVAAPGGNPFDVTGLAAGSYNVVVVAAGCTLTNPNNPVFVAGPPTFDFLFGGDPSFTANYAEPCGGITDQDIWINGNMINPGGYTVFYDPVPPGSHVENNAGSVLIIHELVADTYLVRLTNDASGCTFERTLIVESPVGINQAATAPTPATCNANNGGVNVFLVTTCGQPPFTYRLFNETGITVVAGPVTTPNYNHTFTGLAPGTYLVRVRDGGGDIDEMTVVVGAGDTPVPLANPVAQPTGCTTQDGAFNVTLSQPVPDPVEVEILLGGNVVASQSGNSNQTFSFSGLTQGLYTVRVTDATNCPGTTTVELLSNLSFSFSANVTAPTCAVPIGTITFDLSAGTAPAGDLTVVFNGVTSTESGFPFTRDVAPGTYTVQITGAGCDAANGPLSVVVPPVPSVNIVDLIVNDIAECGGTGGFSVVLAGAAYPVNFVVSNQTGQVLNGSDDNADGDSTLVFDNLAPGTYTLQLADAVGCGGGLAEPVVLTAPVGAEVNVELNDPCPALGLNPPQGGSIVVNVVGGASPYQYTLIQSGVVVDASPGTLITPSYTFSGLTEGTFRVEVRDASNCLTVRDGLVLTAPAPLNFSVTGSGVACPGGRGSIRFSGLSGGTPPYDVSYNGTDFQGFGTLDNGTWPDLPPGTYTARIRDSRGCLSSPQSVEVTPPLPALDTLSTLVVHPRCAKGPGDAATGSFTVNFKDGTPPYRIYTTAESDTVDLGATPSFTRQGVAPGNYAVYMFDACTLRTFVLRINPGFEVDVDANGERCITDAQALDLTTFVRTPLGGRWEDRRTPSNVSANVFSAPTPGNYTLYYVYAPDPAFAAATCEDTLRLTIHPEVEAGEPAFVCEGAGRFAVSPTPPGGTWSVSDPGAQSLIAGLNAGGTTSVAGVKAGTYLLTYNRLGCEDDLMLTVHPTPKTRIVVGQNPERLPMNEDIVFAADTAGSHYRAPYEFNWEFMHGANLEPGVTPPTASGQTVTHQYKESGDYTVRLITTNDLGCADTVEQRVTVGVAMDITFPNVITPNGDGVNDRFEVNIPLPGKYKMRIFDRHGVLMARLPEDGNAWAPKDNVPDGVYYFTIEAEDPKLNRKVFRSGQFTILR